MSHSQNTLFATPQNMFDTLKISKVTRITPKVVDNDERRLLVVD